ncbi:MAG: hypothetical protein ACI9WU_001988 [Myxococcota bacterium]|jgi:hypothetical protein
MRRVIVSCAVVGWLFVGATQAGCAAEDGACAVAVTDEPRGATDVVVNEVMAQSQDGSPDWIELYNRGGSAVDIGCWSVIDKSSKHIPFFLAPGVTIEAGGFHVLVRDKTGDSGFTWGFASDGDRAILRDDAGLIADETQWDAGQAQSGNTWGRSPDGTGDFATLLTPTMGAVNAAADPNPPVLPTP